MKAYEISTLFSGKGMNGSLKKYIVISTSCSKAVVEFVKTRRDNEKILEVIELKHGVIIDASDNR